MHPYASGLTTGNAIYADITLFRVSFLFKDMRVDTHGLILVTVGTRMVEQSLSKEDGSGSSVHRLF